MRKIRTLLFLGIWVTVLPYLGFPYSWQDILFTISGLILVFLSFLLYRESISKRKQETFDNFSENRTFDDIHERM